MNFIRIQSKQTINVTPGLEYADYTNYDSDIPNRLKVSAAWPKATVQIREGVDLYPAEIAEWSTVKALEKNGVLTISTTDETPSEKKVEEAEELKVQLEKIEEVKKTNSKKKKKTLEDAAE